MKRLFKIQQELKAPKNQFNSFGGYNYRSCEDILNAVKPILKELDCVLTITDEVVNLGERYYVKAIATLLDNEGKEIHHCCGMAREQQDKKGMDQSQITGATSSYARKYALNGLFCIDDVKDADATNKHGKEEIKQESKLEKTVCPKCGKSVTEKALQAWGCCSECKKKESK